MVSRAALKPGRAGAGLDRVLRTLTAGAVVGFLAIMLSISSGNLLLSGGMREFLPVAIGMALFSSAVAAAIAAVTSPIKGAVAVVQPIPLVAIAATILISALNYIGVKKAGSFQLVFTALKVGMIVAIIFIGGIARAFFASSVAAHYSWEADGLVSPH